VSGEKHGGETLIWGIFERNFSLTEILKSLKTKMAGPL
jgi:hypothetical protein